MSSHISVDPCPPFAKYGADALFTPPKHKSNAKNLVFASSKKSNQL